MFSTISMISMISKISKTSMISMISVISIICLGFLLSERTSGVSPVIFSNTLQNWQFSGTQIVIRKPSAENSKLSADSRIHGIQCWEYMVIEGQIFLSMTWLQAGQMLLEHWARWNSPLSCSLQHIFFIGWKKPSLWRIMRRRSMKKRTTYFILAIVRTDWLGYWSLP